MFNLNQNRGQNPFGKISIFYLFELQTQPKSIDRI